MQTDGGGTRGPTHPGGVALASPEPEDDPRLGLFRKFLRAIDRNDHRAGIAASQALRQHSISVVTIARPNFGGGRHGA